jgi:hypothetical protein
MIPWPLNVHFAGNWKFDRMKSVAKETFEDILLTLYAACAPPLFSLFFLLGLITFFCKKLVKDI